MVRMRGESPLLDREMDLLNTMGMVDPVVFWCKGVVA